MYDRSGHGPNNALHEIDSQRRFRLWQQSQPHRDELPRERFTIRTALISVFDALVYALVPGIGLSLCVTIYAFILHASEIGTAAIAAAIAAFCIALISFLAFLRIGNFHPEQRIGHRSAITLLLLGHEVVLIGVWLMILWLTT